MYYYITHFIFVSTILPINQNFKVSTRVKYGPDRMPIPWQNANPFAPPPPTPTPPSPTNPSPTPDFYCPNPPSQSDCTGYPRCPSTSYDSDVLPLLQDIVNDDKHTENESIEEIQTASLYLRKNAPEPVSLNTAEAEETTLASGKTNQNLRIAMDSSVSYM